MDVTSAEYTQDVICFLALASGQPPMLIHVGIDKSHTPSCILFYAYSPTHSWAIGLGVNTQYLPIFL